MLMRIDGSYAFAACDDESKSIYISEYVENSFLKKVLCHELTHAAMFSYNVDLSLEQEELLADLIATYGQEIISITNQIFRRIQKSKKAMD